MLRSSANSPRSPWRQSWLSALENTKEIYSQSFGKYFWGYGEIPPTAIKMPRINIV